MNILVVGAAGVVGRRLIPLLVQANHTVAGTTRQTAKSHVIQEAGATPILVDVFDRQELRRVVHEVQPDVIIHQLTDLGKRDFTANGRLRRIGTRNLVDAAKAAGVRHMIAQSIAWAYAPGNGPADEDELLDLAAPEPRHSTVESVHELEQAVLEMELGTVLRYGLFYGPGTWYAPDGVMADQVRHSEIAVDDGITSFVHVDDAAQATLQALDWPAGVVNIVDDEPAAGSAWLPVYATALGVPTPAVRQERPPFARGALNTKARRSLHWQLLYPSWRTGFAQSIVHS